jgi:hypothetical protein
LKAKIFSFLVRYKKLLLTIVIFVLQADLRRVKSYLKHAMQGSTEIFVKLQISKIFLRLASNATLFRTKMQKNGQNVINP